MSTGPVTDLDRPRLDAVLEGLSPEVRSYGVASSTNELAGSWASEGAPEWSVVVADVQTEGRGRSDRTWYAPAGSSLLFSVVVRPAPRRHPSTTGLAAGIAVARALRKLGYAARLKWPNDVTIAGKKVSGILSELRQTPTGEMVIVGIGINVTVTSFPPPLDASATSLVLEDGVARDRAHLLAAVIEELKLADALGPDEFTSAYTDLCETIGMQVRVQTLSGNLESIAVGVDPSGALMLSSGQTVHVGDVVHVRPA